MTSVARIDLEHIEREADNDDPFGRLMELEHQSVLVLVHAVKAAQKVSQVYGSLMRDENDGAYAIHTDIDLSNADMELRAALRPFTERRSWRRSASE